MKKRIISMITIAAMTVGMLFSPAVSTAEAADQKPVFNEGRVEVESFFTKEELPVTVVEHDIKNNALYTPGYKASAAYLSDWDKYGSYIIYNKLSDKEKAFWDNLNEVCYRAITSNSDYSDGILPYASGSGLGSSEILKILKLFLIAHPQYYFLESMYYTSGSGTFSVYSSFRSGSARSTATNGILNVASPIISGASLYSSAEEKVRYFQKCLCFYLTYDNDAAASTSTENRLDQCIYSAFVTRNTVCAGYAKAMSFLCNAVGIDCMDVTSDTHEWNKVRLDGDWYNIDVTWADQEQGIYYNYYLKSDSDYLADTSQYRSSHVQASMWSGIAPSGVMSSTSKDWNLGTYTPASTSADQPAYVTANGSVTLSCGTSNARIYYTTDGSTPAEAATKSKLYSSPFSVGSSTTVKAIAVADKNRDSEMISFVAEGNTSDSGNTSQTENTDGKDQENKPDDKDKTVAVTGISLSDSNLNLTVGKGYSLTATVTPANATNKNVTWSSSDTSIATVSTNGYVEAKGVGTAYITATTESGLTASCYVEVLKDYSIAIDNLTGAKGKVSSVTAYKKKLKVKVKSVWADSDTVVKYQIRFRKKGNSTWKKKTVSSTSLNITGLKANTKYQIGVRPVATIDGEKYYGKWSTTVTKKTKK